MNRVERKQITTMAFLYDLVFSTQTPNMTDPTMPPTIKSAPKMLASSTVYPNPVAACPMMVPRALKDP